MAGDALMPTRHEGRVIAYGYRGRATPPPMSLNIIAEAEKLRAKKRGSINTLRRLGRDSQPDEINPIILPYSYSWPSTANSKSSWTRTVGATDYLEEFAYGFPGVGKSLCHVAAINEQVVYLSGSNYIIPKNGPWALRLRTFDPDGEEISILGFRCHRYQFQLVNGSAEIMRLSQEWTQGQEDVLNILRGGDDLTSVEEQQKQELIKTIYEDYTSFSLGRGDANAYLGTVYTIAFVPEPGGNLNILVEGENDERVPNSKILQTRLVGELWPESPLEVRAKHGSFLWQVGYPWFAKTGQMRVPLKDRVNRYFIDSLGDFTASGSGDASLPGTGYATTLENIDNINGDMVLTLSTTNPRYTPFVYTIQGNIAAGDRTSSAVAVWDSDDHRVNSRTVIEDIDLQIDAEFRRVVATVVVRDMNGTVFNEIDDGTYGNLYYPALENRVVSLEIDGQPVITNGIVKEATLAGMKNATPNTTRANVTNPETKVVLIIADQWAIMDEDEMADDCIGDGMKINDYLRQILKNGGVKSSEMSGITANSGRRLPTPALGEPPCIRPGQGVSRGDYLRSIVEKYGLGKMLYITAGGIWTFGNKSTTVVATIATSSNPEDDRSLKPLDSIRDNQDFYTHFRVEGAEDVNGNRLCDEYTWHEAERRAGGPPYKGHIGRRRSYPTVRDEGLRTQGAVTAAVRSLAMLHGKPGRYWTYDTHFNVKYIPGFRVSLYGQSTEIVRVGAANMRRNKMQLTLREVIL